MRAESLVRCNEIRTPRAGLDVRAEKDGQGSVVCELAGASPHESAVFLSTLREVLAPVQNPNWLLTRDRNLLLFRQRDYHAVPQIIGRKKQQALYFHRLWCRHVGPSVLYNTRTPEGRLQLVRARGAFFGGRAC